MSFDIGLAPSALSTSGSEAWKPPLPRRPDLHDQPKPAHVACRRGGHAVHGVAEGCAGIHVDDGQGPAVAAPEDRGGVGRGHGGAGEAEAEAEAGGDVHDQVLARRQPASDR